MRIVVIITLIIVGLSAHTAFAHDQHTYFTKQKDNTIWNTHKKTAETPQKLQGATRSDTFVINASAYTAAADECGKSDGITASGKKVQEHHTLACPRGYAFGTKIHIKFDIYMKTKAEAFAFGRRNLVAYVIS